MANSTKFIREIIGEIEHRERGLRVDITVALYDNGIVSVNGRAFSSSAVGTTLSLGRQLLQIVEVLEYESTKRKRIASRAAGIIVPIRPELESGISDLQN